MPLFPHRVAERLSVWSCCLGVTVCLSAAVHPAGAGVGIVPLETTLVASGLEWPVFATHAPGDYDRLYILEKRGRIRVLNLTTGMLNATPFLNIDGLVTGGTATNDERGLLGLAFHPDYQANGYFYVDFTGAAGATTVRRYSVISPDVADDTSGLTLLTIAQPFSNHNGGWLGFGPNDGYLYIGTGDGGSANDPGGRAQDTTDQLLGKMLRIDVDASDAGNYGIPPTNPFVGVTGDDEIWAFGLRNPWRSCFDRANGDLYIADVGQNAWEEINVQPGDSGGRENYGWRCMEGLSCTGLTGCTCNAPNLTLPIRTYSHACGSGGFSITGGYVYRGCAIPSLEGTYFYADYVCGNIWSFTWDGSNVTNFQTRTSELSPSAEGGIVNQVSSFGEDALGEMYIVDQGSGGTSGAVYKIVPETPLTTGDIDGDGLVNASDLALLLGNWGNPGCSDLNMDGTTDAADLALLLGNWS